MYLTTMEALSNWLARLTVNQVLRTCGFESHRLHFEHDWKHENAIHVVFSAFVVQRTRRWSTEPEMGVRFPPGARTLLMFGLELQNWRVCATLNMVSFTKKKQGADWLTLIGMSTDDY